jgi:hypothetical protein
MLSNYSPYSIVWISKGLDVSHPDEESRNNEMIIQLDRHVLPAGKLKLILYVDYFYLPGSLDINCIPTDIRLDCGYLRSPFRIAD